MDVIEAIRTRRTTKAFSDAPVPRGLIEQVLEAAVWAPNHRLTEPWEFIVVQGEGIERLGQLRREMTAAFLRSQAGKPGTRLTDEQIAQQAEDGYRKATAAPVTVAVTAMLHDDPAIREEDYAATAAAIQNLMLAAHGLGLASFWSTNKLVDYPPARAYLGLADNRRIVGLVQLGYAAAERGQRRVPAEQRTRWIG